MFTVFILPIAIGIIFYTLWLSRDTFADVLAKTILLFELLIVLMANLLSVGSRLNRWSVFWFWIICTLCVIGIGAKKYKKDYFIEMKEGKLLKAFTSYIKQAARSMRMVEWSMVGLALILLVILLAGAILTVPYNYDSMTYHLARIGYWIDHGNVNYYVTNIDRQLFSPVLAEYNLLAVMLLSGNDYLLNLQQYVFAIITAFYLYKIARMIGTNRTFSMLAAFAYLTMPLTISQAVTTQNDLSAGLFFALFVYELLWFIQTKSLEGKQLVEKSILIGATVGFAFLMKVSVCASMVMFMPWVIVTCIKRKDTILSLVKATLLAGVSMLAVIAETLTRTYQACGSFMADTTSGDIMIATGNISYIIVNILKNYSLLITQHFVTALNGFIYRIAIGVGRLLHVEVNNIAISYHGFDFITYLNTGDDMYSHDRTSSAFVSYLALIAGVLLVIALSRLLVWYLRNRKTGKKKLPFGGEVSYGYVISAWLGFGIIMAILRWQPWGSRLMYPALTMTIVASMHMIDVFTRRLKRKEVIIVPLLLLSVLLCIKPVQDNLIEANKYVNQGFTDRERRYFAKNDRKQPYRELWQMAKEMGATDVAVVISGDGYDYPLWKLFRNNYPEATLRHILVDDEVMKAKKTELTGVNIDGKNAKGMAKTYDEPDCILWIERGRLEIGQTLDYFGTTYECIFVSDSEYAPDSLLVKKNE